LLKNEFIITYKNMHANSLWKAISIHMRGDILVVIAAVIPWLLLQKPPPPPAPPPLSLPPSLPNRFYISKSKAHPQMYNARPNCNS